MINMSTLRISPISERERGTSWLELFAYYEALGGSNTDTITCGGNRATPRASLKVCLAEFKGQVRRVAATCLTGHQAFFFAPSRIPEARLSSIGFTSFVACISARIHLPADHNKNIVRQLLCLRTRLTQARHSLLEQELLKLPMAKVTYFGIPAWRRMRVLSNELPSIAQRALDKEWPLPMLEDTSIKHFIIHCPTCATSIQAARHTLWSKGKWASIHCSTCAAARTARLWKCPCQVTWPNCAFHAPMGYRCGTRVQSKRKGPPGTSRGPKRPHLKAPILTTTSPNPLGGGAQCGNLRARDLRISTIQVRNSATRPRGIEEPMGPPTKRSKPAASPSRPKRKRTHCAASASSSGHPPPRSRSAQHSDAIAAITRLREARSTLPRALAPERPTTARTEGPCPGPG